MAGENQQLNSVPNGNNNANNDNAQPPVAVVRNAQQAELVQQQVRYQQERARGIREDFKGQINNDQEMSQILAFGAREAQEQLNFVNQNARSFTPEERVAVQNQRDRINQLNTAFENELNDINARRNEEGFDRNAALKDLTSRYIPQEKEAMALSLKQAPVPPQPGPPLTAEQHQQLQASMNALVRRQLKEKLALQEELGLKPNPTQADLEQIEALRERQAIQKGQFEVSLNAGLSPEQKAERMARFDLDAKAEQDALLDELHLLPTPEQRARLDEMDQRHEQERQRLMNPVIDTLTTDANKSSSWWSRLSEHQKREVVDTAFRAASVVGGGSLLLLGGIILYKVGKYAHTKFKEAGEEDALRDREANVARPAGEPPANPERPAPAPEANPERPAPAPEANPLEEEEEVLEVQQLRGAPPEDTHAPLSSLRSRLAENPIFAAAARGLGVITDRLGITSPRGRAGAEHQVDEELGNPSSAPRFGSGDDEGL